MKRHNRVLSIVFAALFFAVLVLPYPLWTALRGSVDAGNYENRPLAEMPQPGQLPIEEFPARFEAWMEDHAPFRNQWMALNAALNYRLFGTVESETVLLGQEDWLFYKNAGDSASLDDYQGTNLYTEEQMAAIAADLNELGQILAQQGIRLAVLVAPNKELVYRRYMPEEVPMVNEEGRVDALVRYLAGQSDVPVVWPEEGLRRLSATQQVYYRYDTHWNDAGAAYASAVLLQALGLAGPLPQQLTYAEDDAPPQMDLAYLSAVWRLLPQDTSYTAANWPAAGEVAHLYSASDGYYDSYAAPGAPNAGKLLMFTDSFGAAMQQPLAAAFEESVFVHINAFGENTLPDEAPDVFVVEVSQRYCDRLLDYLPRLVAWARQAYGA
ncbi:hypothetical protein LJC04_04330 [Ruminococcaceae bacterium OttesenSCG-928-O06]|nr:hypothetical protein [Ruminococcaceae bacterium OttesenSCG-928-O06]